MRLRFAVLVSALALWPAAAWADPSYVYLGIQTGKQPVMEFIAPFSIQKWGQQTNASILKVLDPSRTDSDPAYRIESNIYDCARKTIRRDSSETYDKDNHLLEKVGASQIPVSRDDSGLDRLAFDYICTVSPVRKTAALPLWQAVGKSRIVMVYQRRQNGPTTKPAVRYLPDYVAFPYGIAAPQQGYFHVPTSGGPADVHFVYRAPDGHLVIKYGYRADQSATGYRSDYYDMRLKRPLFPDQAQAMAHSRDNLDDRLRPADLRVLESDMFDMLAPHGSYVDSNYYGGSLCRQAYANSLTASGPEGEVEVAFFRKREKPENYESICGGPKVQLHYENVSFSPIAPDTKGFLAKSYDPVPLVWFDWRLHSKYFAGQRDVIAVPWEELQKFVASGEESMPGSNAYEKAEALIAHYGDLQMKGRSPFSVMGH